MNDRENLLMTAAKAAVLAGKKILEIYDANATEVVTKQDNSPLTQADLISNEVIMSFLKDTGIPILSEESKKAPYSERSSWDRCWIVDPLDGTKEFINRNGEFTVNIALATDGIPEMGIIYVPVSRTLYIGDTLTTSAYRIFLDEGHGMPEDLSLKENRIRPQQFTDTIKVVGSRSHMNDATKAFVENLKERHNEKEIITVSKGSSLKFCLVAEGNAHLYPRFAPTMEWDTAAGHAICSAVGVSVRSEETGEDLKYNKENLLNSHFLVSYAS